MLNDSEIKAVIIRMPVSKRKELRMLCLGEGITMQDYVMGLIDRDLYKMRKDKRDSNEIHFTQ